MPLGNRRINDLSYDEVEALVEEIDANEENERPLGEGYSEQEIIEALAVCAAGISGSMDKGDMAGIEESVVMIKTFLLVAAKRFGKNWCRERLFEHVLEVSIRKFELGAGRNR